jgi:hypothetical protein
VKVSQVCEGTTTRPLVWQLGTTLNDLATLREDRVRINIGSEEAGPEYDHAHVLVFTVPK